MATMHPLVYGQLRVYGMMRHSFSHVPMLVSLVTWPRIPHDTSGEEEQGRSLSAGEERTRATTVGRRLEGRVVVPGTNSCAVVRRVGAGACPSFRSADRPLLHSAGH